MDFIIKESKLLLDKINEINKNVKIEIQIEKLNMLKNSINEFDIKFNKMEEILKNCDIIRNQNKKIFNDNVKKIKDNIIDNSKDKKDGENNNIRNTIYYKPIIEEIDEKLYKDFINIPVVIVDNEDDIPNNPIYYINNTKHFGIKINNNLLVGNIGNIYNKQKTNKQKTKKCNKVFCNKKECYFYHNNNRNFMNYSWIHSISYKTPKTKKINGTYQNLKKDKYNTRVLGSRDTLIEDLQYVDNNEKELRNSQLMHDILIYQILSNYLQ